MRDSQNYGKKVPSDGFAIEIAKNITKFTPSGIVQAVSEPITEENLKGCEIVQKKRNVL